MPDDLITAPLPRDNPATLVRAGRVALREVPRLRRFLTVGFLLTYGIFLILGVLGAVGGYHYIVQPLGERFDAWTSGLGEWQAYGATALTLLLWVAQLVLLAASLYVAFQIALAVMTFWFEALARRIVNHWRRREPLEAPPFRLGPWMKSIGRSLFDSMGLILMSIFALFLGFVPVVGPALVLIINGWLLGRDVRDPYLSVRGELGDDPRALRRGMAGWTLQVGLLPAAIGLVPVVGWALLPACMIHLVAGFAWQSEQARQPGQRPAGSLEREE